MECSEKGQVSCGCFYVYLNMLYLLNYVNCSAAVKENMCGGVYGVFRKRQVSCGCFYVF